MVCPRVCQETSVAGLTDRDHPRRDSKPWNARMKSPFVPKCAKEAEEVVHKFAELGGLPPSEYLLGVLELSNGGAL